MKAWYFSNGDRRLRNGDGREIRIGETHAVSGDIELCSHGLHASKKLIDAIYYAPGNIVYRVEMWGKVEEGGDKVVAQKRTYLSGGIDVSETLRKFARMCALDVIDMWEAPDIVIRYLKTGDKSIRDAAYGATLAAAPGDARDAAMAAALDAAPSAALAAALDATSAAAWSSARAAARAVACDSTCDSAWAAARSSARAVARASARNDTWDAASTAAQDEARRKQNGRLTAMITRAIREHATED